MLNHLKLSAIVATFLLHSTIAQAETVLRLNEFGPNAGAGAAALADFKKEIETGTHGAVRIEVHFAGGLGNPSTSLQELMSGDLDMVSGDFGFFLPILIDDITGLEMPFMVGTNDAARRYIASPRFEDGREKDLHLRHIRYLEMDAFRGPSRVIASTRPIASLDALNGLKLAIYPAPKNVDTKVWEALGVSVVDIAWKDVAGALKEHRIDAVIAPGLDDMLSAGITWLAPYVGRANDHPQIWQISINEPVRLKLTPAEQSTLAKAALDAAVTYNRVAEQQFEKQSSSLRGIAFGKEVKIDALAAHERLLPVYDRLIAEGGTAKEVRDNGNQAVGLSMAIVKRAAGEEEQVRYPVGVGQEFRDCAGCPLMVVVPSGEFEMGSPNSEKGRFDNEGSQHHVVVSHPFAMAKVPTTMGDLRAWQPGRGPDPNDNDPAVMVTWFDAVAYADWLSQKTGKHYHLPTEAEFEYAARARTTTPYYWGETIGANNANCFGCGSRWDGRGSSPVGSFPPNHFGLYDMTGNVFEWVADCYFESEAGAPSDAFISRENVTGTCPQRTIRGTSSYNLPIFLRSAYRFADAPDIRNARRGFRLVRD